MSKIKHDFICDECGEKPAFRVIVGETVQFDIDDDGNWRDKETIDVDYEWYYCVDCWLKMIGVDN